MKTNPAISPNFTALPIGFHASGFRGLIGLLLLVAAIVSPGLSGIQAAEPLAWMVSWVDDPARSAVVDWHVGKDEACPLYVREKAGGEWREVPFERIAFPFLPKRVNLRARLENLTPDTDYEIRFGSDGVVRYFRTMPTVLKRPLKFVVGGDTRHNEEWHEGTNRAALAREPDFIVIGGDLAYDNGEARNASRVAGWFDSCAKTLTAGDGRIIPILTAIGNHEVRGGYISSVLSTYLKETRPELTADELRSELAPYYYSLFPFPGQPGYGVLDFGDYLTLFFLDTNHTNEIRGAQTAWLDKEIAARAGSGRLLIPIYHVPAYPSVRPFEDPVGAFVRGTWLPRFEKAGVRVAFENHDHAWKRSKPILAGREDPEGIVFFGDGAWGVETRKPDATRWYIDKCAEIRHFNLVTLAPGELIIETFDEGNKLVDTYRVPLKK